MLRAVEEVIFKLGAFLKQNPGRIRVIARGANKGAIHGQGGGGGEAAKAANEAEKEENDAVREDLIAQLLGNLKMPK